MGKKHHRSGRGVVRARTQKRPPSNNRSQTDEEDFLARTLSHVRGGTTEQVDISRLRKVVQTRGLNSASERRKLWPLLVGIECTDPLSLPHPKDCPLEHDDIDQVERDVERSSWRIQNSVHHNKRQRKRRVATLSHMVNASLAADRTLHYYQGYHDIALILLLAVDCRLASAILQRISQCHIRPWLHQTLHPAMAQLSHLFPLIARVDPVLFKFLAASTVQPYFALSWVITWFSHDLANFDHVCRLFDLFLASHPMMPLYFSASLVLMRRSGIMECECEYSAVHVYLCHIPIDLPLETLLRTTLDLFEKYPPEQLQEYVPTIVFVDCISRGFRVPNRQSSSAHALLVSTPLPSHPLTHPTSPLSLQTTPYPLEWTDDFVYRVPDDRWLALVSKLKVDLAKREASRQRRGSKWWMVKAKRVIDVKLHWVLLYVYWYVVVVCWKETPSLVRKSRNGRQPMAYATKRKEVSSPSAGHSGAAWVIVGAVVLVYVTQVWVFPFEN
eukprot:TRINITY_DN1805_c0_g1_i2.p1 TRINITY_DN1805_c0_g1~~TRINITY_DN1805_c0_g1_i2.p1  ORF type:complete len:500 (+),score=80.79 TRINITY_DN1805_c0_g1_i2:229-1728(+)